MSTGLLALLTTKELTPLLASCGGADKKKVEEAHKAALHHEKCVAEELKDFQADDVAYAQETKERTEEMEEMKREYEEEKQERMADAEVEAEEAGDDAHEEATEAAREEMHVEDAPGAGDAPAQEQRERGSWTSSTSAKARGGSGHRQHPADAA